MIARRVPHRLRILRQLRRKPGRVHDVGGECEFSKARGETVHFPETSKLPGLLRRRVCEPVRASRGQTRGPFL